MLFFRSVYEGVPSSLRGLTCGSSFPPHPSRLSSRVRRVQMLCVVLVLYVGLDHVGLGSDTVSFCFEHSERLLMLFQMQLPGMWYCAASRIIFLKRASLVEQ